MSCPRCQHPHFVKNGRINEKQRYKCKKCNYQWTENHTYTGRPLAEKALAVFLLFFILICSVSAQPFVKVAVLRPSDQPFVHQHETDAIREAITEIQSFFASEMNRHGYGKKTFKFETHIPVYIGVKKLFEYEADADVVRWQQGHALKDFPDDIHLIFLAGASQIGNAAGVFTHRCDATGDCNYRRLIVVPLGGSASYKNRVTAHELGHAFGFLEHLTTRKRYIMESYLLIIPGADEESLFNFQLHPDVAKTLNASKDLSVMDGINTEKFDKIVRRPDESEVDVNDNSDDLYDVPHLVAYYPFDENANDASGNDNHGQGSGTINYVDGKFGKALELNRGAYIEMEATNSLHGDLFKANPFTLSTWIYPNPETVYGHVWRGNPLDNAGHHTLFIIGDGGGISWRADINGKWTILCETRPGIVKANEWIHVAVTNDGDSFRIYANGENVAKTNFRQTDGGNKVYSIGSRFPNAETFKGWIDDYAIFTSALSEVDIKRIIEVGVKQFFYGLNDNSDIDIDTDVNDDGYVDLSDVLIVRGAIKTPNSHDTDVNNDGVTDEIDVMLVKAKAMEALAAAAPRLYRGKRIGLWGDLKRR